MSNTNVKTIPNNGAWGATAVTLSDTVDISYANNPNGVTRWITSNDDGDAEIMMMDGSVATLTMIAGVMYPVSVKRILATGSTVTSVWAFQ